MLAGKHRYTNQIPGLWYYYTYEYTVVYKYSINLKKKCAKEVVEQSIKNNLLYFHVKT